MADFGYNNNAIRNRKMFKPVAYGNAAVTGKVVLTERHSHAEKNLKAYEGLIVNLE